jgi:tricorn protease
MSTGDIRSLLYTEWEDNNRSVVDRLGGGKIAYVHMRDMSPESLNNFLVDMNTYAVHKEALILDLRFNNGGNVHKEVIDFLSQKQHFKWSYRNNQINTHPNVTPGDRPIIVLINERSLSDAEVTSNGIKTLSIAKLVGTETYRWIIFTSGVRLVDGSSVRLPAWGCYSLNGKDLESSGVVPDIYVKNTFKDRLESKDPQLERAIKELLPL